MTLSPQEFMRRFLLHVLPGGFHRIRHYGLLAPAKKAAAKAMKHIKSVKTTKATKPAAKAPARADKTAPVALKPVISGALKPIKTAFNKSSLVAHLASIASVDSKAVRAVVVALEATIAASIAKKGAGQFMMPGLFKT